MKINVGVSIGRNSKDEIKLTFTDEASNIQFLDVRMTPEQFAMAITGLSGIEVQAEARELEVVGKTRITERRSIECPLDTYDRKELTEWLKEHGKEEGWIVAPYLGSQSSIARRGDKVILNYSVYRFESEADTASGRAQRTNNNEG